MAKDHFVRSFWTEKFQRRFLSCAGDFTRVSLCLVLFGYPPSLLAQVQQGSDQQSPGTIVGTVEDQSGAVSVGARVRLNHDGQSDTQEVLSGNNGQFSFTRVPPGPFHLTITWQGFNTQEVSGVLQPGEFYIVPLIALAVSGGGTEVRVALSPVEVAQEQIKEEEKQRVFGIIPNFYVTYDPDPAPLNAKQKFELAW